MSNLSIKASGRREYTRWSYLIRGKDLINIMSGLSNLKKFIVLVSIFFIVSQGIEAQSLQSAPSPRSGQSKPTNYVFFNLDRAGIKEAEFYNMEQFEGAQIKYTWRSLEKEKGEYDFSSIEEDLAFLSGKGKKLFLQIQDVSFVPSIKNVPDYILNDPAYHGGADLQYEFSDDDDNNAKEIGWVARCWDSAVADRFHELLNQLGQYFDGRIEGITLPETAVDFGSTGKYYPSGFSPDKYRDALKENMKAARSSFNKSVIIQYANFMPGEWLPWDDKGYLSSIFEYAREINVGVGGPDIVPYRKGQMNHSYHFALEYQGLVKLGYAVQEGNYAQLNASTGKKLTVPEIYNFAANYLKVDYIFWYPQEPYFTRDLKPFLSKIK